jgi:hypothetical protein
MPAAAASTRHVGDITCMISRLRDHLAKLAPAAITIAIIR